MKKLLPYIGLSIALLLAAGVYLQFSGKTDTLLSLNSSQSNQSKDQSTTKSDQPKLSHMGTAPDLAGITKWINSDALTMQSLRGKVVLVHFWTYSCINCIRTLPYLTKWYEEYKDKGLIIIGVHTPEFAFEKVTSNVEAAVKRYGISYPVAQDNNYKTWTAYSNQFWPASYLVDQNGTVVYTHFGEGNYDDTEYAIRTVLGLEGAFTPPAAPDANQSKTPDMYLGTVRLGASFGGSETPSADEQIYVFPKTIPKNKFALEGKWRFEPESVVHTQGFARIRLQFNAAKAFMVAESREPTTVKVYIDGKLTKGVVVSNSDLYSLYESTFGGEHILELEIPTNNVSIFTFTFK